LIMTLENIALMKIITHSNYPKGLTNSLVLKMKLVVDLTLMDKD
jgi:hypothetical protein